MPQLTVPSPKGRGGAGQRRGDARVCACKWMEDVNEDEEREPEGRRELQRGYESSQTPADARPCKTTWSQFRRALRPGRGWYICAPVAALWSVCRADEPPSSLDACGRLALVCLLWVVAGGVVQALKQFKGETPQRVQHEVVAGNDQEPPSSGPGHRPPLALALADSLLLCVLQEPLPDPGVAHIQALLRRLESVSRALEQADAGSGATDADLALTDKAKLIHAYLRQRTRSLRTVIQAQQGFEAGVADVLRGADDLWAQLEQLHTEVTITKEASGGHRDLAAARTDAETLSSALGRYRSRLQSCQASLTRGTQLLQELTWSRTHISDGVSGCGESLWPELLLQSNMEQFDRAQQRFLSLEQQTCAFRAHLEGLGHGTRDARACALVDADADADAPLSLCERSALQLSSTIGRLRRSARRK